MRERSDDDGRTAASPGEGLAQAGEDKTLWDIAAAMRTLGPQASMAQIAREAGLTPAALYQRFPTPDILRSRLAEAFYDRLLAHAEQIPGLPVEQRLERFLRTVGLHLALSHSVLPDAFGEMASPAQRERIYALTVDLLEQSRQAGVVAADVALSDIAAAVWGLRGVIATTDTLAPDAWERHLDVVVAGLRDPHITFSRPPLDAGLLDRVIHRSSS
ncbi:TetR/AcrR family transcriptional regulator [Streptomyces sp. NPDC028635]|uniref:TetR/AcrR family transcriptional regulator n=1 Tax=Streptomyces sp. NPDC028635 TaxID=3154800 RepID=UPI0033D913BC